jgi:hypothetical protein
MGDEPYTKPQTTFSQRSGHSTNSRLEYATIRAKLLFGCYRRGDANDPETYVAAVAAVLCGYENELIREVTDPRTGIHTSEKFQTFPPNVGELKGYCEALAIRKERLKRLGDLPRPDFRRGRLEAPEAAPGSLAQVFVPEGHQRYADLVGWCRTAPHKFWKFGPSSDGRAGLWVAHGAWSKNSEFLESVARLNKQQAAE